MLGLFLLSLAAILLSVPPKIYRFYKGLIDWQTNLTFNRIEIKDKTLPMLSHPFG
jgi:hypothetical protein